MRTAFTRALPIALILLQAPLRSPLAAGESDCSVTARPSWKPTVEFPFEPFRHEGELASQTSTWIKFTILLCEPDKVYFQNSNVFAFHYDFATSELDPFKGMSNEEYDQVTLHAANQQAVLGAVLFPKTFSDWPPQEFGVQLVRQDPYTVDEIVSLVETVSSKVIGAPGLRTFYFPAHEQAGFAREHEEELRSRGVEISTPARWANDDIVYSPGWALGRLRFVESSQIEDAYVSKELLPSDILITDGVPAEIPFVQGIISLEPSTPNSHVAILANNFRVPFVTFISERDNDRALELDGRRVILRAHPRFDRPDVRLIDVEDELDSQAIEELLALKALPPLDIQPVEHRGEVFVPVSEIDLSDVRYTGGKAANYALLLEAIPEVTRPAGAITFDLWNAFLDQPIAPDRTLRDEIASRLAPHMVFPPADPVGLHRELTLVRDLIRDEDETSIPDELRQSVLDGLLDERYGFDPFAKIRFRSSTNVEDAEQFTGAGLYESFSGCLADELDGDDAGPSLCDSDEDSERGVFRAIRRVFASFYSPNAFLERRRWGISEDDVGMAILVHHSFPDSTELANGVATLTYGFGTRVKIVSQKGAVSVANPDGSAVPEVVTVDVHTFGKNVRFQQSSSLVVLGESILDWKDDYETLTDLFLAVGEAYERRLGAKPAALDFEFKKIEGEGLVVKQVRRIPVEEPGGAQTPFLVNEPVTLETFQSEGSHVLPLHRLKSTWGIETRSGWLTPESLAEGLFDRFSLVGTDGCSFFERHDILSMADYSFDGGQVTLRFELPDLLNPRRYELAVSGVPSSLPRSMPPIVTPHDFFNWGIVVHHAEEVLGYDPSEDRLKMIHEEFHQLAPEIVPSEGDILVERIVEDDGIRAEISFYWPPAPRDLTVGYTAPLAEWRETRITGLTAEPFVLTGSYSQSYAPLHHNVSENFLFVPTLEPDISPAVLAELRAKDVYAIWVYVDERTPFIETYGASELGVACDCIPTARGDVNGDGARDLSDGIYLLQYLFASGPEPVVPIERTDLNGDSALDISDPVFLFRYLFLGGDAPPSDCLP